MKMSYELKIFVIFLFFITVAEIVTSLVDPTFGLIIHSILFLSLVVLSAFWQKASNASNLFLGLSIAPLIRIFALSLPLAYFPTYAWYLIAGVPMLMAAFTIMWIQKLKPIDIGINIKNPPLQLAIMLTGIPFGILEYLFLTPAPITTGLSAFDTVLLAGGFIVATGFTEELVFRGVLQNNVVKAFGSKIGLIAVSVVFAVLHIGWLNIFDVILVFSISLFFGVLMLKTGSLAGVSLSHGLTNVFLFIVMPSAVNFISLMAPK